MNFFFLFCMTLVTFSAQAEPIKIELYYETLCPYCKNFIVENFKNAYKTLLKYPNLITFDFIAYGNVKETEIY